MIASAIFAWFRRHWLAGIAGVLAVMLTIAMVSAYFGVAAFPTSFLVNRSAHGDTRALSELNRRLQSGTFQPGELQHVFEIGLDAQGDGSSVWTPEWAEFMERAVASGKIETPLLSRFLTQGVAVSYDASPNPALPRSFVFTLQHTDYRTGDPRWDSEDLWLRGELIDIAVANQQFPIGSGGRWRLGDQSVTTLTATVTLGPDTQPGEHTATARYRVSLIQGDGIDLDLVAHPKATVNYELECFVEISP